MQNKKTRNDANAPSRLAGLVPARASQLITNIMVIKIVVILAILAAAAVAVPIPDPNQPQMDPLFTAVHQLNDR